MMRKIRWSKRPKEKGIQKCPKEIKEVRKEAGCS